MEPPSLPTSPRLILALASVLILVSTCFLRAQLTNATGDHPQASPAFRGAIRDREGSILAQTSDAWNIVADCAAIPEADAPALMAKLAANLQVPVDNLMCTYLAARVVERGNATTGAVERVNNRHLVLVKGLTADAMKNFRAQKWPGVYSESAPMRVYPNGALAAHVIGFLDSTGQGMTGAEKEMEGPLTGSLSEMTENGAPLAAAKKGDDVSLTISLPIQHVVEEELERIVKNYAPATASIIVMDPRTGEILGMGSRPTFDPNNSAEFEPGNVRNRCLTDPIEPGSLFEIIPLAGALNEGLLNLDTPIFCENGDFHYGGRDLLDGDPHGTLPVREVIAQSSNIGSAKIALNYLHEEKLYEYATAFGMGRRTGLFADQGETAGLLRPVSMWSGLSVTRIPIGQEVLASPIQLVLAMSVIANGGKLMVPLLVHHVTDSTGRVVMYFPPRMVRQVISSATAGDVAQALRQVAIDGTAKDVKITGADGASYAFAGKSCTTQKFFDGAYSHSKHVVSFAGFLAGENPKFVILVLVDEPHTTSDSGAQVCAPVFADMAGRIATILHIAPDQPSR